MNYTVKVYDLCGCEKSTHGYDNACEAVGKYDRVVKAALNRNIGRVELHAPACKMTGGLWPSVERTTQITKCWKRPRDEYYVQTERGGKLGISPMYRTLGAARAEFNAAVSNNKRHSGVTVELYANSHVLDRWASPKLQVEGYIVHSLRSLNGNSEFSQHPKTFHKTEAEAVSTAKRLAKQWRSDHEGLVVLKAVKHVHRGDGVVVEDLT